MGDLPEFTFDDQGVLHLSLPPFKGPQEAICPLCSEPIRWVLDMMSFLSPDGGTYRLAHARCAWLPEAFDSERAKAAPAQSDEKDAGS